MVAFHLFFCLRNVCRQIATSSDTLLIQNDFQIGLQNVSQVQSLCECFVTKHWLFVLCWLVNSCIAGFASGLEDTVEGKWQALTAVVKYTTGNLLPAEISL